MENRQRLLQGATALLYFGPLLAGLGGFGWRVIPVFVAIFLLWLFILRPQIWPRRPADWARPEAAVTLASQGAVQVLLVAVCFGIGRGIGGVLAALPPFPLMLPVAISFLSIPLARMVWDPWHAETKARNGMPEAGQAGAAAAGRMVAALAALPEDVTPEVLEGHLVAMGLQVGPDDLRRALMGQIQGGTAGPVLRRAAVLHATRPEVAAALTGGGYPKAVFDAVAGSGEGLLFAGRCAALVAAWPDLAGDCPDVADLQAALARHGEEGSFAAAAASGWGAEAAGRA